MIQRDKDSHVPNLNAGVSPITSCLASEVWGGVLKHNQNCNTSSDRLVITSNARSGVLDKKAAGGESAAFLSKPVAVSVFSGVFVCFFFCLQVVCWFFSSIWVWLLFWFF